MRIDLKFDYDTIDLLTTFLDLKNNDYYWNGQNIKELSDEHIKNIINYLEVREEEDYDIGDEVNLY